MIFYLEFQYSAITVKRGASRNWTGATHLHYYFVNLLVFDLIQAIGEISTFVIESDLSTFGRWYNERQVDCHWGACFWPYNNNNQA